MCFLCGPISVRSDMRLLLSRFAVGGALKHPPPVPPHNSSHTHSSHLPPPCRCTRLHKVCKYLPASPSVVGKTQRNPLTRYQKRAPKVVSGGSKTDLETILLQGMCVCACVRACGSLSCVHRENGTVRPFAVVAVTLFSPLVSAWCGWSLSQFHSCVALVRKWCVGEGVA